MTVVAVLAFSLNLSERIKTYGAYAGFAAIIGLAVLSVLYFAQAREVKRLRAWAGRGPERAAEQNARADAPAATQKRVVAEPVAKPEPATAAAQSPAPAAGVAAATAAGTGAAIAGVAAATDAESKNGDGESDKDKPDEETAAASEADGEQAEEESPEGEAAAEDKASADDKASTDDKTADEKAEPAKENKRQTSVAMAPIPASARVRASATPRTPRTPVGAAAGAASAGGPNGNGKDKGNGKTSGGHRRLYIVAGVVAGLVAIAIVYAVTQTGGGSKSPSSNANQIITTPTVTSTTHTGSSAPPRSQVNVVVLNGTTTPLLAKSIGARLSGGGFQVPESREGNAPDQTHPTTIVAYAPGEKAAATEVARSLGLGNDAVTPMDPNTQAAAGPPQPNVVVIIGADLSH